MTKKHTLIQLYPTPALELPLEGLYLHHAPNPYDMKAGAVVYTNFISSLDGRIAIEHPVNGSTNVPTSISNPRDWRLFQELAAQADVLVASARYIRELAKSQAQDDLPLSHDPEFADLHTWRRERGMTEQPSVVILSASLNLPFDQLARIKDRPVYVATGDEAEPSAVASLENSGIEVLRTGTGDRVEGGRLIDALREAGFRSIYSIAGPGVLETLLSADVLDRLYLTHMHRLIGGASYDTLLEGEVLDPPSDLCLRALYYDQKDERCCGQLFGVYDLNVREGAEP